MDSPLLDFWLKFKNAFNAELENISDDDFKNAWKNCNNRTKFYENSLLERVAKKLNLEYKKEDFKIDYTFCKNNDGNFVPLIYIESENFASTAHHEIRKLSCLSAPLKILIVCSEWSDAPNDWNHGGEKPKLMQQWSSQIKSHNQVWSTPAITGVIIAEWNTSLKYYSVALDHLGEEIDTHQTLFTRKIS